MSTTALATPSIVPQQLGHPWRTNWIISRRDDLTWFIGSAAVSYVAYALMAGGFPVRMIYLIWMVGVDGPHVIAIVTRTYFDKQERARLGLFLWRLFR